MDYLERVRSRSFRHVRPDLNRPQVADELYPETLEATVKQEGDDGEDVDLEEMLKRELAGMNVNKKSTRFRKSNPFLPKSLFVEQHGLRALPT